jgi:transcriptional regulator with XRE-family HTH domain
MVRHLRRERKLSQIALADLLDVSPQQISKYENGIDAIPHARLLSLAARFEVPMAHFFEDIPSFDAFAQDDHDAVLSPADFTVLLSRLKVEPKERLRFLEQFRSYAQERGRLGRKEN